MWDIVDSPKNNGVFVLASSRAHFRFQSNAQVYTSGPEGSCSSLNKF